jgi:DNA-binding SARP family transcriptional activator
VQFDILGPLQVRDAGRPLVLGRPKQRAVLAILLLNAGRAVSLDRLVDELWGQQAPPQALASVQAYVSHLRRLLEPGRAAGDPARVLVNQPPGYRIVVPGDDLDAARFQTLAVQGHALLQAGDPQRAAEALAGALRLWRGPVLADFADAPFVQAERTRLAELRLTALEDRLSADLGIGRHALIVAELEQLTAEHPFRERLQGARMVALYRCGRQAEALQTYQRFSATLREELGLDPGPALRNLERDILRQAAELEWAPGPGVDVARPVAAGTAAGPTAPAATVAADTASAAASGGLVGREEPLRVISRALTEASAGRGRVVLLAGEPGIGKTRLAEEAARRAREAGVTVAWGSSDEHDGAPAFWPWVQVLRALLADPTAGPPAAAVGPHAAELALILPELADGAPRAAGPVLDVETSRFRLCQAAIGALVTLSADRRLLLVLDDLQWADVASHRLLSLLTGALSGAPIVVLATYRDRSLDGGEPLADTLASLARMAPVDRLVLAGLGPTEVAQVMASQFSSEPDQELARLVSDRTGGNPFFVIEVLRLLGTHGWPELTAVDAASVVAQHVPAGVRDVLRRRLSRLPDQTRTVLLVAAVTGQEFDLDIVRAATGVDDDDALDAVELALLSGLVVEDPVTVGRFRFAHALIREAIYSEISRARRARLHARVGQALLDRRGSGAEHARQVAHHWWLAAPAVGPDRAIPHVVAAAHACLDTLAHEEAERLLRRSLDLLSAAAPSAERTAWELDVRLSLGKLMVQLDGTGAEQARANFARARELADELGDSSALLAAYRSLYEVAFARADHRGAAAWAQVMLDVAERKDDLTAFTLSHLALGRTLWCQGRLAAARDQLEQGLRVAGAAHPPPDILPPVMMLRLQLAAVLDPLGEQDAAAGHLAAAIEMARRHGPFSRAVTLAGAALLAAMRRDLAAARAWATEVVALAEELTFPTLDGYAAVVLDWLQALQGDPEGAIVRLRRHLGQIEAGGAQHLLAWGMGLLAEAHLRVHQPEEALRLLDDALVRVERTGERLYESELHRLRALCLLDVAPPRAAQACEAFDRAVAVAEEQGAAVLQRRAVETRAAVGLTHSGSDSHPAA